VEKHDKVQLGRQFGGQNNNVAPSRNSLSANLAGKSDFDRQFGGPIEQNEYKQNEYNNRDDLTPAALGGGPFEDELAEVNRRQEPEPSTLLEGYVERHPLPLPARRRLPAPASPRQNAALN